MVRLARLLLATIFAAGRRRANLVVENLALRQQLAVLNFGGGIKLIHLAAV